MCNIGAQHVRSSKLHMLCKAYLKGRTSSSKILPRRRCNGRRPYRWVKSPMPCPTLRHVPWLASRIFQSEKSQNTVLHICRAATLAIIAWRARGTMSSMSGQLPPGGGRTFPFVAADYGFLTINSTDDVSPFICVYVEPRRI